MAALLAINPMVGIIDGFRSALLGTPWNLPALAISTRLRDVHRCSSVSSTSARPNAASPTSRDGRSMTAPAISVEGIGKLYQLAHLSEPAHVLSRSVDRYGARAGAALSPA